MQTKHPTTTTMTMKTEKKPNPLCFRFAMRRLITMMINANSEQSTLFTSLMVFFSLSICLFALKTSLNASIRIVQLSTIMFWTPKLFIQPLESNPNYVWFSFRDTQLDWFNCTFHAVAFFFWTRLPSLNNANKCKKFFL